MRIAFKKAHELTLRERGAFSLGLGLQTGVYFVKIEGEGKVSKVIRIVKQ
jgi:hypothetical protein